ncbi:hypothetical protein EJ02DRAFT_369648 [Clathrospora elynae]|uniref:DNA replication checkpoint mediator MRC1 domain-containing protein n=1 Tax=Clathrospora elynae TaxID=706981 RepID=A0A6A5SZ80_9PLEO|nr:hypothetical protein EJ02DRAFT_369648 [Clathrospora elynae]
MVSEAATAPGSPKSTPLSPHARAIVASANPRPKLLEALRKPTTDSSESETESEDEASVLTAVARPPTVLRPQPDADVANEEESDGEGAYERMKKRFAASKNPTVPQEAQKESPVVATIESSEDEDEMPVRTKARKPIVRRSKTASPPASPSPGLFVTPDASPIAKKQPRNSVGAASESDDSSRPFHNADLQERVHRIRAERLANTHEEADQQTKPKKAARQRGTQSSGSDTDGENGRRLTQHAKPTRRAGKKAMEAMARDQQRISRNMQLTHQAKTKKRYTTKDLFKRFGFQAPNEEVVALPTPEPSSTLASSDAEANHIEDTPPTSPPRQEDAPVKEPVPHVLATSTASAAEQDNSHSPMPTQVDKGKGRAPEFQHLPVHPWMKQAEPVSVQNAVVDAKKSFDDAMVELSDSDNDLQAVQPKSRFPVFDRIPTEKRTEAGSLVHLRALAQLARPPRMGKNGQKSVTLAEMEFSLAQKARQQTIKAREERMADLVHRGHPVETEEEREKRETELDDMVAQFEKQRQEDLKLGKMERKEAKDNGEVIDELPSSDEEDADYVGSGEEDANQEEMEHMAEAELELSGSEDEQMEDDEEDGEGSQADNANGLIDEMADEDDEPEDAAQMQLVDDDADMEDEDTSVPVRRQRTNRPRTRVVEDDEAESDIEAPTNASPTQQATQNDAMAAFGFGNADTGLGLTQMFAGTMADLVSGSQSADAVDPEPEQDSLDFLRGLPETQPGANFSQASDFMVPNSQSLMSPQKESQTDPETQFSLGISQLVKNSPAFSRTQLEDFELTQDAGFSFSRSPAGLVLPPSTVDTVMMPIAESPTKQKKGKLQRGRRDAAVELSDVEEDLRDVEDQLSEDDIQLPPKRTDAFMKLAKAAKKQKAIEDFNKKTSMAKEAVLEQAEESEDEYAGVGGASDDDEGEEDQDLKDMIDHNDVKVDERQIAAFYAEKSKKDDDKQLAELYKKMQNGGLRRRVGGHDGFDMSDSEDEAETRQRNKRAAFQRQTNALLKDQKVKALADDDKKKAFFKTLANYEDEDEYDFLAMAPEMDVEMDDSQSQEQQGNEGEDIVISDSQADSQSMPAPINPLKRKSPDSQKENRPPPHMRRTAASDSFTRKPISEEDIKNSVSELLDDPRIIIPDSQFEDNDEDYGEAPPGAEKRAPIIDRLTLSRTSSISEAAGEDTNLAFHAPSRAAAAPGFRVPSLIRQATSNLSITSERSATTSASKESGVRRGGTGKSNIHAQAREAERRELLEKKEGKRKAALRKKVEGGQKRGMRSVLSDLGGGFE